VGGGAGGGEPGRVRVAGRALRALQPDPFSGFEGGYTNRMAGDDEARVRENYGASYERLAKVKRSWDPGNLFCLNLNVTPAGEAAAGS